MGRDELVKYLQKHPHQVGAWTQDTVNELELDLDYFTDVLSTNTGGIFEVHIGGFEVGVFAFSRSQHRP